MPQLNTTTVCCVLCWHELSRGLTQAGSVVFTVTLCYIALQGSCRREAHMHISLTRWAESCQWTAGHLVIQQTSWIPTCFAVTCVFKVFMRSCLPCRSSAGGGHGSVGRHRHARPQCREAEQQLLLWRCGRREVAQACGPWRHFGEHPQCLIAQAASAMSVPFGLTDPLLTSGAAGLHICSIH